METIYFKGSPCHTYGPLPNVGEKAPCFTLVAPDMKDLSCHDFTGQRVILNIFPSIDTDVCAASVRRFNQEASELAGTVVLGVSMDLPFAAARFCTFEHIKNVIPASAFRSPLFAHKYGVQIVDGPLAGLLARAVVVIDSDMTVLYHQLVEEITDEPDYKAALDALRNGHARS